MSVDVHGMREENIPKTVELFKSIIDELHLDSSEEHKNYYKEAYSAKNIARMLSEDESMMLVAEGNGEVIGYLIGRAVSGVGTLSWVGVRKSYRGKGITTRLLKKAISLFNQRRCFQVDLYVYPRMKRLVKFLEAMGFERKAHLEKTFLGTSINYMVKPLRKVSPGHATKRIVISGRAGQGIKLIAQVLAKILAKLGKEVSLCVEYGPSVRSGKVEAELVYSEEKIEVPMVDRANILVVLSAPEEKLPVARRIIVDDAVTSSLGAYWPANGGKKGYEEEVFSFARISQEKFGNFRFTSMLALGHILRVIGIAIDKVNFESALPSKFVENNIEAIQHGFALRHNH